MKRFTLFTFLYLALGVCLDVWQVQSQNGTMEAILQAFPWLLVVLLQAELIVIAWQVNPEH